MIQIKVTEHKKNKHVRLSLNNLKDKRMMVKLLKVIGEVIVGYIIKNKLSGQVLSRQTGKLAQSIAYMLISNKLKIYTNMAYGAIHEYGGVIIPVNAKYLRFTIAGTVIFTKRVVIPKRPYMWTGIQESFSTGAVKTAVDIMMNKYLKESVK